MRLSTAKLYQALDAIVERKDAGPFMQLAQQLGLHHDLQYEGGFNEELLAALDAGNLNHERGLKYLYALSSLTESETILADVVEDLRFYSPFMGEDHLLDADGLTSAQLEQKQIRFNSHKAANTLYATLLAEVKTYGEDYAHIARAFELKDALNELIKTGDYAQFDAFMRELFNTALVMPSGDQIHAPAIPEKLHEVLGTYLQFIATHFPGFDLTAAQAALKGRSGTIHLINIAANVLKNELLPQQILANEFAADCDAYLAAERDEIRATWEKIKDANSDWSLTKRDGNFYMKHRTPHQGFSTKEIGEMYPGIKPVLELCAQHNAVNSARRELAKPKTAKQNIQAFRRRVTKIRRNPDIKPSSRLRELFKSIERKLSAMTSNVKSSAAMFSISTQSRAEQTLGLLEERLAKGTAN